MDLGVAVFAGLGGGHLDDLAGTGLKGKKKKLNFCIGIKGLLGLSGVT